MRQPDTTLPLHGTTVLQFGGAAGYCGRLLAGLGATVVLVEPPAGCSERRQPPFAPGPLGASSSLSFAFHAAGLRSVAIDATTADGADVLRKAIEAAQVCVSALSWEGGSAWVEACEGLLAHAGQTPVCHVGPTGDLAGIGADDLLVQAASGLMYISGFAEGEPTPAPGETAKMQNGLLGATTVLGTLLARDAGSEVPPARVGAQAALSLTTLQTANPGWYTWQETVPKRAGTGGLSGSPIPCKDGWVTFTVPGERWPAFIAWLNEQGIATDSLPATLDGQVSSMIEAMTAARPLIEELASRLTKQDIYHSAQQRGILCMPVNDVQEVLDDGHLQARGFFVKDAMGAAELEAPFRSKPGMWRLHAEAPALGEFTEEFLTELGYTRGEVESLHAMGAVQCGH